MRRALLGALVALAMLLAAASPAQAEARAAASGAWSDPGTWGGGVPGPGDAVTIPDGRTVTVDTAARARSVDVAEGATLAFAEDKSATLELGGNLMVEGTLRVGLTVQLQVKRGLVRFQLGPFLGHELVDSCAVAMPVAVSEVDQDFADGETIGRGLPADVIV